MCSQQTSSLCVTICSQQTRSLSLYHINQEEPSLSRCLTTLPSPSPASLSAIGFIILLMSRYISETLLSLNIDLNLLQKYFVLRARRGLITDGFFSRCRNPNYLGEMMIYGSFASMVLRHPCWWFPWTWLAIVWSCLFYPSWLAKDASMSRYPEWPQYTAASGM